MLKYNFIIEFQFFSSEKKFFEKTHLIISYELLWWSKNNKIMIFHIANYNFIVQKSTFVEYVNKIKEEIKRK